MKFQFSFKTLLFLLTVISLLAAGYVLPEISRLRVEECCRELLGVFRYTDEIDNDGEAIDPASAPSVFFFGDAAGRKIGSLEIKRPVQNHEAQTQPVPIDKTIQLIENMLAQSRGLDHLQTLTLKTEHPVSSRAIELMGNLNSLRFVQLHAAHLDQRAVAALSQIDNLEVLVIQSPVVSTDDFAAMMRLKHLAWIQIIQDPDQDSGISKRGLESLRSSATGAYVTLQATPKFRRKKKAELREQYRLRREREAAQE